MKPKQHQRKAARRIASTIIKYGICILAGEVRSGKTISFITACILLEAKKPLIITKKDAIKGIKAPEYFTVTNFEQVKNLPDTDYDIVVIDEFHSKVSSAEPKCLKKTLHKTIKEITYNVPCIFSSGTPTPEGYASIYSALALSSQSPFSKYKSFVEWHKHYGIKDLIVRGYDRAKQQPIYANNWKKAKITKIKKTIDPITVTITQVEAGHKFFPTDNLINIPLSNRQQRFYDKLRKDKLFELPNDYSIVCDKNNLNQKLHQISGGFCKTVYDYNETITGIKQFKRIPKIEYIKQNYDLDNTIIFCFYQAEQEYLSTLFPNVESITKKAEGTDYSHFDKVVIYSFSFRAVVYEQIRARQMNFKKRDKPIVIDFLISGIDEQIYEAVAIDKKNFTNSWYRSR